MAGDKSKTSSSSSSSSRDPKTKSRRGDVSRRGVFKGSYKEVESPRREKTGRGYSRAKQKEYDATSEKKRKRTPVQETVEYERPRFSVSEATSTASAASIAIEAEFVAATRAAPSARISKALSRFASLARRALNSIDFYRTNDAPDQDDDAEIARLQHLAQLQEDAEAKASATLERLLEHEVAWRQCALEPGETLLPTDERRTSIDVGAVAAAKADAGRCLDLKVVKLARLADQARRLDRDILEASVAQRRLYEAFEKSALPSEDPKHILRKSATFSELNFILSQAVCNAFRPRRHAEWRVRDGRTPKWLPGYSSPALAYATMCGLLWPMRLPKARFPRLGTSEDYGTCLYTCHVRLARGAK